MPEEQEILGTPPEGADIPDLEHVEPGLEPIVDEPTDDTPVDDTVVTDEPTGDEPVEPTAEPNVEELQKSVEELQKKSAENQTRYQNVLAKVKPFMNRMQYRQLKSEAQPQEITQPVAPLTAESIYDMPPGELIAQITKAVSEASAKSTSETIQQSRAMESLENETRTSNAAFEEFVTAGDFTKEEVNDVINDTKTYGVDVNTLGGPATIARIALDKLNVIAMQKGQAPIAQKAEIAATDKVRMMANTTQPTGASPTSVPPKSFQDNALAALEKAKSGKGVAGLFGT